MLDINTFLIAFLCIIPHLTYIILLFISLLKFNKDENVHRYAVRGETKERGLTYIDTLYLKNKLI